MLKVGLIDNDIHLQKSLMEFWGEELEVQILTSGDLGLEGSDCLDVVIVDPQALEGKVSRFVRDLRERAPGTALVFTYVYNDVNQNLEETLLDQAEVCVVKPFDLHKLKQTIRWAVDKRRSA